LKQSVFSNPLTWNKTRSFMWNAVCEYLRG